MARAFTIERCSCWFLSSLACICEYNDGELVRQLFPGQTILSSKGAYVVRLCVAGRWEMISVDDRSVSIPCGTLPCVSRFPSTGGAGYYTQLCYCSTARAGLWYDTCPLNGERIFCIRASLVEKAFAKICGGYPNLVAGQCQEALALLTGWPTTRYELADCPDQDLMYILPTYVNQLMMCGCLVFPPFRLGLRLGSLCAAPLVPMIPLTMAMVSLQTMHTL